MKPVHIDFDRAGWKRRLLGQGPAWERSTLALALGLAASVLALLAWRANELGQQRERLQLALDRARTPVAKPVTRSPQSATPAETLRQMDAATARLNVPWSDVMDVIERNSTASVALLVLEPDARIGSINLTTEARSLHDLLSHAEALGQDSAVASVRLSQHEIRAQESGQPVRMTLSINPTRFRQ